MNEVKVGEKKPFDRKGLALGFSIVFVLCIGLVWGYVASQSSTPDSCLSYDIPHTNVDKEGDPAAKSETTYATFTLPDTYFTFEYPATWTFEKEESNPGEEYNETFYNFYADADKKQNTITLHFPMSETALDTCLKFSQVANYKLSQFATNDAGTFVSYLDCEATANWPETKSRDLGSSITWQKGTLSEGDTEVALEEGKEARIQWDEDLVDPSTVDHIAHSIKVIR